MWLLAANVMLLGLVPCLVRCVRGTSEDIIVALETANVVVVLVLLLLAVGFDRSVYADVGILTAALSFAGGLVFVRALEAWE
jgi:multisubunit Na+/H+ antiporter MnhF subunit